ncbi:MAG: hypothetical protein IJR34_07680 [Bacteroidales bacterium]|nr:hypothetical protein [Bacteroidales bacterium]
MNLNNGNTNNNNRNNNNYVRAVSEFHLKMENMALGNISISFSSLLDAYQDCKHNKAGTPSCVAFDMHYMQNLVALRDEINAQAYEPGKSIAFVVHRPVDREVFAADFRDRIIHHWIAQRIEPLLEKIFIDSSFNCRKDKGTLNSIYYLRDLIKAKSQDYTRDCWVLKWDLKGFFMSINRQLVCDKLCAFLADSYKEDDLDTLLYLCRITLLNAPEKNCVLRGDPSEWDSLPANKSLFTVPDGYGLPIGNLPSQLVANFLLNDADHYLQETLDISIDRYVDDCAAVDEDEQKMLLAMPLLREYLWKTAQVTINPKKYQIQHYSKGVKWVGGVVKFDRLYLSNRTVGAAYDRVFFFNRFAENHPDRMRKRAEYFVSCINSYLGLMVHFNEYGLRRRFVGMISPAWFKYVYSTGNFSKLAVKKKYKHRERIKTALRKQRHKSFNKHKLPNDSTRLLRG